MRYTYPAILTENELGGYSVDFPDLAGAFTDGDDFGDAVEMASEVLELAVAHYIEHGTALPAPFVKKSSGGLVVAISVDVDTSNSLVPTKEAAVLLGVNSSRVRQLISSGQLAYKKQGRDNYVYRWSINQRLAESRTADRPHKLTTA
ncbi:MAG: type II toxin-antitoxin system HicB family antitoxin [Coriobacteriales bacterium]|jgi:predicted RNase H-like HicB family nuclease|nr:type II toxin-antitoxin system HicB family antitoxin [Coriobacteriales bacterium]